MSLVFKSQHEVEAVFSAAMFLKLAAYEYPRDDQLAKAAKRAMLVYFTLSNRERQELSEAEHSIIRDRLHDCEECVRVLGYKPCESAPQRACRYGNPTFQQAFIKKNLGQEIFDLIQKYIVALRPKYGK